MKNFSTIDIHNFNQDELISMFEAIRDHLELKTKTSYSEATGCVYNSVSNRIRRGELKSTDVDGTIYIPLRK